MTRNYLKIVKHYEKCLEQHGDTHLGVDWPIKKDVDTRYRIMLGIMNETNEPVSLLDFGCGAAHLLEFIKENELNNISYTGLDISPKYISLCRNKFPGVSFLCSDILQDSDGIPSYDYIILNGVFTEKRELKFNDMYKYFKEVIIALYNKANIGISFNVMSKQVDWERDDLFHLPLDLLAEFLTKKLSRHYVIRNDYGLYEYSVYLFKQPLKWQK